VLCCLPVALAKPATVTLSLFMLLGIEFPGEKHASKNARAFVDKALGNSDTDVLGRPPRVPVDLQALTRDVKARIRRVIGELEAIEQQQDPILASPKDVYIDLDMAIHQLESAMSSMRKAWWPPP
jgi:hypothetical protein